jgi:hypothetical protein
MVEKAGYTLAPADHASWFERNYDFMFYQVRRFPSTIGRKNLGHAELSALTFFYRQSPTALSPTSPELRVGILDPPYEVSGMVTVLLDAGGRLIAFVAVPPQVEQVATATSDPNWNQMIADSGIDVATLKPAESTWLPPLPFDRRFGWSGFYPEDPKTEIQISAASYRGRPVYFHVIGPWTRPWREQAKQLTRSSRLRGTALIVLPFFFLVLAAVFARRNIHLGRGDRRGAIRVSIFAFVVSLASWLLAAHIVPDLAGEWQIITRGMGQSIFAAAFLWLIYLAVEPFVRRQWPELLISWTRLLSGGFRDPLIGRDLLAGILAGGFLALIVHFVNALPDWINVAGETAVPPNPLALGSLQELLGYLLGNVRNGLGAFFVVFALFLTRTVLRRYWLSVMVTGILVALVSLGGENFVLETPGEILETVIIMFVVLRLGMLALAVMFFTSSVLINAPITLDLSKWYAPHSLFLFAVLLFLLFYGLRVATGNKPLLVE